MEASPQSAGVVSFWMRPLACERRVSRSSSSSDTPTVPGGDESLGNHQQLCSAGLEDEKLSPGTHKESQAQVAPDANIHELLKVVADAAPILLPCTSGDRTAFLTRVPLLGQHKEHVLLQYILAGARYPSMMDIVAEQYSHLPATFTAADLKAESYKVITRLKNKQQRRCVKT